jgi:hypothetical protein
MKSYIVPVVAVLAQLTGASLYGESNLNHSCVLSELRKTKVSGSQWKANTLIPRSKIALLLATNLGRRCLKARRYLLC